MIRQPGDHFAHGDDPEIDPVGEGTEVDDLVRFAAFDLVDDLIRDALIDAIAHRLATMTPADLTALATVGDNADRVLYSLARAKAGALRSAAFTAYATRAHDDGIAYAQKHSIGSAFRAPIPREFVADVRRFVPQAPWLILARIGL